MSNELKCWNCGKSVADVPLPISRHANCSHCFEVLHCCRMCRHYDDSAHIKCSHERAEPPVIKESANFCDYFKPTNRFDAQHRSKSVSARTDLEDLFGDESEAADVQTDPPKSKLDDLFDD